MAKTMKRTFRAALRWRLGLNPVKNINFGLLLGTACSWVLLLLGCASADADEATTPPYTEQQATEQAAEPASPLMGPSITGPFVIPQPSPKYTLGPLGDIYVDGIGAGIVQWQNNRFPGNRAWQPDLSNGQLFIQKPDGLIQFYAEPGAYSIWVLGSRNVSTAQATFGGSGNLFGWFPTGYLKIAPSDDFSFRAGKLQTLIGAEYPFSFQNINPERGIVVTQLPAFSKGGQADYKIGPLALSLSFNDGFDSGVYNWITGAATYTLNSSSSFTFVAGGNAGKTNVATTRTPLLQNNSEIYNLIYTYESGPWIIQPYFSATHVPINTSIGITSSASSFGGSVLADYSLGGGFFLGAWLEYIGTAGSNDLLYGPGSGAFAVTVTPAYQYRNLFVRGGFAWVRANNVTTGLGFGPSGTNNSQTRVTIDAGILF
jgi:Putative beta-barrel porin-2, OmpL-like. bbp2